MSLARENESTEDLRLTKAKPWRTPRLQRCRAVGGTKRKGTGANRSPERSRKAAWVSCRRCVYSTWNQMIMSEPSGSVTLTGLQPRAAVAPMVT